LNAKIESSLLKLEGTINDIKNVLREWMQIGYFLVGVNDYDICINQ